MDLFDFPGQAFRTRLRRELSSWREEGWIDARAEEALRQRYALEETGAPSVVAAIYILGAMLIGGGVFSLLAWNWHAVPPAGRLALAAGAMLAADMIAHRLLPRRAAVAHGIFFLASLLFGAAWLLLAHCFGRSIEWNPSLLVWSAASLALAWIYRSDASAGLAVVLAVAFALGRIDQQHAGEFWIPPAFALAFLPYAWTRRSRPLFFLAALGTALIVGVTAAAEGHEPAGVIVAALAWVACLVGWPMAIRGPVADPFHAPSRTAAAVALFLVAFPLSFHEVGRAVSFADDPARPRLYLLIAPLWFAALLAVVRGFAALRHHPITATTLAGITLLTAVLWLPKNGIAVPLAANLLLSGVAIAAITSSLQKLARGPFWLGTVGLGILIVSRFFEYQTDLLLKALVFVLCGAGAIVAGMAFERRFRA